MPRKNKKPDVDVEVLGLLGVGFDNEDGHKRVTQGEEFLLIGGSEGTHGKMQDVAIHVTESLDAKGKRVQDAALEELAELIRMALERTG